MNEPQTAARPGPTLLFAGVAGLGAFLAFSVQPLLGKRLLPWFGGTSALWTTCMLFFQAALLGGYAWAHALARHASPRRQRDLHLGLLALALLLVAWRAARWPSPVTPGDDLRPQPADPPVATVFGLLASAMGVPFVALTAGSPLLSAWLARLRPPASSWRLFAWSNAGSLLALVAYPLWIEPRASLRAQGWGWSAAFAAYALAAGGSAVLAARAPAWSPAIRPSEAEATGPGLPLLWLGLSAFPVMMLLAVTSHITQEVAAVPLLWTLPLALYLVSFVITFGWPVVAQRLLPGALLVLAASAAVVGLARVLDLGVTARVGLWSFVLLAYALAGHGELVRRRPGPGRLTGFYLTVAAGGALGGVVNAVLAPRLFDGYWELHVAILAGPLLVLVSWLHDPDSPLRGGGGGEGRPRALRLAIAGGLGLLVLAGWLAHDVWGSRQGVVLARRSFYGVLRVVREQAGTPGEQLKLLHGRIAHGLQLGDPAGRRQPTTYFGPSSGVGLAIARHPRRLAGEPMRVGVVGLGVGTLAAWSRPGDVFRFYELDPEVARLSQGERPLFTYLRDAAGSVSVVLGDGRLALEREPSQQLDVLVLDAFSSDAIPAHLLTREAFSLYQRHLRPGGVIAVQVTNRYLDLQPVVRGAAAALGLRAEHVPSYERGVLWSSDWMLVGPEKGLLDDELISAASLPPLGRRRPVLWSDDWSDLVRVLKR
ncbi:MAG TPA: fused MFS/spermidine synthase [Vicinamibacteria bacterium]|nr:fused MFS/spermidine synthase [Vicinamibacteria bacterium]